MRIGIDLGGTKIEGIALDERGEIIARQRIPTPRDYDGTVAAIASLVADIERTSGRSSVGIGIPGTVEPNGLVKNANSTWLIGRPLIQDLEQTLSRPVRAANDANCFAISEAADGAGAGFDVVFGVILGTGVGGGIVVQGPRTRRAEPRRRRMGPQSAAVDDSGRVARAAVLLRHEWLYRNVSLRPRARGRLPSGRRP